MITFTCKCGKTLKTKDEVAGKLVRCPACNQPVRVPQAQASGDELKLAAEPTPKEPELGLQEYVPEHGEHRVEGEAKHCPKCHVRLPAAAVICTTCGFDFRTGKAFEPPRTLLQKIPWKTVRKVVIQLALLALIAGLGYWAYRTVTSTPKGGEGASPSTSTSEDRGRGEPGGGRGEPGGGRAVVTPGQVRKPPVLRVVTKTEHIEPAPRATCRLQCADGEYAADDAIELLEAKVAAEARDLMRVTGHTVLTGGQGKPWGTSEELELQLQLQLGWAFQRQGEGVAPAQPYVATCRALILRENGDALWRSEATYSARRPGERISPEDTAAIAKVTQARSATDLDRCASRAAYAAVKQVFNVRPKPDILAKWVAEGHKAADAGEPGGETPVAQPAGPPREQLLGPLRTKFAEGMGSFGDELAVVREAAAKYPHLALAFAKTAAEAEKDPTVKGAYQQLADDLVADRKPIDVREEVPDLRDICQREADTLLGRMAAWTLATSDYHLGYVDAEIYLSKVAGHRVPDARTAADGSPELDGTQMEILRAIAEKQPDRACDLALLLLLRVSEAQRNELRQFVNLPEPELDILKAAIPKLRSGNASTICHTLKRDLPPDLKCRPILPVLVEVFRESKDSEVRATVLYAMYTFSHARSACLYAMLDMLDSPRVTDRRAAAKGFYLMGSGMDTVLDELKAAHAKEKDPQTRSQLGGALQRAKDRQ